MTGLIPDMDKMPVLSDKKALRNTIASWRSKGLRVGFVPTMGALHAGHMELVKTSKGENDRTLVSIFVNPTQFDRQEDLQRYPRTQHSDLSLLQDHKVDALYFPALDQMYPDGFSTSVNVDGLTNCLEGAQRPGHFKGVATVVTKLLCQVLADRAYFGEKDYQQLLVIKRLARDLDIATHICGVPTVRDKNGLALSSRNAFLSDDERKKAPQLFVVLSDLAERLRKQDNRLQNEETFIDGIIHEAIRKLAAAGFQQIDYIELRAANDLSLLKRLDRPARLFGAAWLGKVRLIDNLPV